MAETIISVYRMSSDFLACIRGVLVKYRVFCIPLSGKAWPKAGFVQRAEKIRLNTEGAETKGKRARRISRAPFGQLQESPSNRVPRGQCLRY